MISSAIEQYNRQNGRGRLSPKAVLFDMDGTLIDTMPLHAWAWTEMMRRHGMTLTASEVYAEEGARGVDTVKRCVRRQRGIALTDDEAAQYYAEKSALFATLPIPSFLPGVPQLLSTIHAAGMTIAIVTGSSQQTILDKVRDTFGAFIAERNIICARDVPQGKPDPAPYLLAMQRLNIRPNEAIVVENAPLGIIAGKRSGAFVIAVNTGPLSDEQLLTAGPDLLFPSCQALANAAPALLPRP